MRYDSVMLVRILRSPLPLIYAEKPHFITDPDDPNGTDFRQDCLAYWLLTTKTHTTFSEYLSNQRQATIAGFLPHLARCIAWHWLINKTPQQIRAHLTSVPEPMREYLRASLNELRSQRTQKEATQ